MIRSAGRPGLQGAKAYMREGDTLVVWQLNRLGWSLKHLFETVTALEKRGMGFHSLQESINTTTSGRRLVFHIFGALAEFERNLFREVSQALKKPLLIATPADVLSFVGQKALLSLH